MGTVTLGRSGLYYELCCCCRPVGETMLQLMMVNDSAIVKLGILIPDCGSLCLHKRIPMKQFGNARPSFCLRCRASDDGQFLAVDPESPFPYLHRIKTFIFAVRNGEKGIIISDENNGEKVEIKS